MSDFVTYSACTPIAFVTDAPSPNSPFLSSASDARRACSVAASATDMASATARRCLAAIRSRSRDDSSLFPSSDASPFSPHVSLNAASSTSRTLSVRRDSQSVSCASACAKSSVSRLTYDSASL